MSKTILFASNNPGKVSESRLFLTPLGYSVISPQDLYQTISDPEETGSSYEENATIKAEAYAYAEIQTIADDSGLEITALDGKPGLHSNRFLPGKTADRVAFLLDKLKEQADRSARFVTVLALYNPLTKKTQLFRGEAQGSIAVEPIGEHGFDYDIIFVPEGHSQTYAQLGPEFKSSISSRAQAFTKLANYLREQSDKG